MSRKPKQAKTAVQQFERFTNGFERGDETGALCLAVLGELVALRAEVLKYQSALSHAESQRDEARSDRDVYKRCLDAIAAHLETGAVDEFAAQKSTTFHAVANLRDELAAETRLCEATEEEMLRLAAAADAKVKELEAQLPTAEQMVVLRADYERLVASLPATLKVVPRDEKP